VKQTNYIFYTALLFLTGCSFPIVEMAEQPTNQKYDLSDAEGDGVISARDKCPNTFSGADINNDGCGNETVEKIRRELLVNFDSGSSVVKEIYYAEIKKLALFLEINSSLNIIIEGHTSIVGAASYNKNLSLERAKAIKTLLINKYNIAGERIESVGYGEERPLLKGNNEYVNAKNRRIVVEIEGEKKVRDLKWNIYSVDPSTKP